MLDFRVCTKAARKRWKVGMFSLLNVLKKKKKKKKKTKKKKMMIVCWLLAYSPSNRLVYLRDGSAQTSLRAATLR